MKKVLVHEGRLLDIVAVGAEFPVASALKFYDAPDDVSPETYIFNGTAIVPRPPKTPAELDNDASNAAKANLTKLRADTYPDVLIFLATLAGAPKVIKDAAIIAAAEKAKVKP